MPDLSPEWREALDRMAELAGKLQARLEEPRPLPCPFCNASNFEYHGTDREEIGTGWIACGNCAAEGPLGRKGRVSAIKAWNQAKR